MKTTADKTTRHNSSSSSKSVFRKPGASSFFAPAVQMKMKVSQPGEKHEQEADAMADKVMRMPEPRQDAPLQRQEMPREEKIQKQEEEENVQRQKMPEDKIQRQEQEEETLQRQVMPEEEEQVQRQPQEEEETLQRKELPPSEEKLQKQEEEEQVQRKPSGTPTVNSNVHSAITQKTSGGQSMSPDVKGFMESRFNADFSKVKIHTDPDAASLSNRLSAKAFTYKNHVFFSKGQYEPGTSSGKHLLAHELTHVIQQGQAVQRKAQVSTTPAQPHVQRLGISDALDYFADKAYLIPGFRMFTIILGVNPINMQAVERNAANILRAIVEFLPGGNLITRVLDKYGVFERAGTFVEQQIQALGMTGGIIRSAIMRFLDSLGWSDIFDLGGVWERAKRIFTEPINRIKNFIQGLFSTILQFIRDAVLRPLAGLAAGTRGYDLVKALLGQDPLTGDPYPRTAETIIGGFMKLIGQEEIWENIKRGNAVARAWAWFQNALAGLMGFVRQIPTLLINTLRSLELQDFLILPQAFAKIFRAFGGIVGQFISWAGGTVLNLLEILFSVVAPGAMPYLRRAAGAFQSILRNPIGFVGNLIRAVVQGFRNFASRIGAHLRNSLIQWLTGAMGGANIYIPQAFNLREIIKFVLSVLGLTWQNIRMRLVRVLGEPAVRALETGVEIVTTLVREGPAAAWELIKGQLSNLRDMVMREIMNFVVVRVVQSAVTKLITSLNPAGAVIQAIISIYNTIMFLVERMRQIIQVGMAVINSMMEIASGAIGRAAAKVEQTMAGLLTLAISFLARIAGLGRISDAVMNIIRRIRQPIDRAIDWLVNWLVNLARRVGRGVAQAGVPQDPNERLRLGMQAATSAVNRFAGRPVGRVVLDPILLGIKTRYGFQALEVIERQGFWSIRGTVNPSDERPTDAPVGGEAETSASPRNITQQIQYEEYERGNRRYKVAQGTLGVPGIVGTHRSTSAQRAVSRGTGDDAGHLIGNIFGGSGGIENLSPQNWIQNRYGTFRSLERQWTDQLRNGAQIRAKVTDIYRMGEDRPFMRNVQWQVTITGGATFSNSLDFANPHTPESRANRQVPATVSEPQSNNVIPVDFNNR